MAFDYPPSSLSPAAPGADLLFVHPYNHAKPDPIPVGAVGAINLLSQSVLGRYAEEVSAEEVARARVLLLDVHWFLPTAILDGFLAAVRRINPRCRIVAGGLTASFYKRDFLDRFDIDYLVAGDVEAALPPLIAHLIAGERPPPLANIYTRHASPPSMAITSRVDFDALDWLTLDWFPSYRERVHRTHALYARRERSVLADNCHPILPLTRGCKRSCHFCYGAYQEEVFGPRVRVRSPEAVCRDLKRLSLDPALHFVTLFFADAVYLNALAPRLAGERFDLDAFLFFCGAATPEVLDQVRSAFSGEVIFTLIQPPDLAPLASDPTPASQADSFARMIRHFATMDRTSAAIFHVGNPLLPSVAEAAASNSRLTSMLAQDWSIKRPDANALSRQSPKEQLAEVVAAAGNLAAAHLLRMLVPALARRAVPEPIDLGNLVQLQRRGEGDPLERRLLDLLIDQILSKRIYGFDGLTLEWAARPSADGFGAAWMAPGETLRGECHWFAGLNGLGWEGELFVGDAALAIAPLPSVRVEGGSPVEIAGWPEARLPTIGVARGQPRFVRAGGEAAEGALLVWIEDQGARVVHRLSRTSPAPGPERVWLNGEATPLPPELNRSPGPDTTRAPWPAATWPRAVVEAVRALGRPLAADWRLRAYAIADTHIDLFFQAADGYWLKTVVCPRRPDTRLLSAGRYSFAYLARDQSRFVDLAPVIAALLEAASGG